MKFIKPFSDYTNKIDYALLISDSTPLAEIFSVLSNNNFAFVIYGRNIKGIITKADINKPPARIYIFGIISLIEMHLNLWINHYYKKDAWISHIRKDKINAARKTYELRKGKNQELTLLECLQLCDKRDLLKKVDDFLTSFSFTNKLFNIFMKRAEKLRNDLAHSQNSVIATMDWSDLVETITMSEKFLIASDNEVESIAKAGTEFKDLLI